jgi:hypothetical protein
VWGHSIGLGACRRRSAPTERPELGPAVAARPGQVGTVPVYARVWDSFRRHHPNATTARPDVDLPTH